jgi:hypothetical protein
MNIQGCLKTKPAMKEELFKLYQETQPSFKNVVSAFPEDDLSGPFLMSPDQHYKKQRKPLLVVGQETNGWTYHIDEISKQMDTYEEFNVGQGFNTTTFWNITRKVENALGNEPHSCAWTNLSKFDLYGGKAYGQYEKMISTLDKILVEEIKIIGPKVCLFFTGPDFDSRLKKIFKGVTFEPIEKWNVKQFCRLKHPELPEYSFRSYHPKSLRLRRLENDFIEYLSNI